MRFGVNAGIRSAYRYSRGAARNPSVTKQANRAFQYMGTPSLRGAFGGRNISAAKQVRSGQRRAAVIGTALGVNAMIGPKGSRGSSGSTGQVRPRSTGGYA
jgi:hypothetical protein